MPPDSIKNREELWQLGEYSPFPNELEIVVYQGRPFHGYIKPREDLKSPFTRDNIIEVNPMFFISYFKKSVSKGTMYKTAV